MRENGKSLSVIIPTYNRCNLVCEAVESVLDQALPSGWSLEVVVVDDASTDGTVQRLRRRLGEKIVLVANRVNCRTSKSRNLGIQRSTSSYLCFLDSDDLFLPNAIRSRLSVYVENPHFGGAVYGNSSYGDKALCDSSDMPRGAILGEYCQRHFINVSSFVVPKDALIAIGMFDTRLTNMEDVLVILKLMARLPFEPVPETITCIRKQRDSSSGNLDQVIAQGLRFMELVHEDRLLVRALGSNMTRIEAEQYSAYLRALYKKNRNQDFNCLLSEVQERKLPGFDSLKWTRRKMVAKLRACLQD